MAKRDCFPRWLDGARLLAEGNSPKDVAKQLGVAESTVYRWLDKPEVMEEYRKVMRKAQVNAVAKAQRVLIKQLDSDAGNGFLAQNAANLLTSRYAGAIMGEDKQEITIHISGGLPDIGMPDRSDE